MPRRVFRALLEDGRPKCIVEGCDKPGQHTGMRRVDGSVVYRAQCLKHHSLRYGLGDWVYKQYRKTYCENIDGRLGFICTATIIPEHSDNMLDTDHINNNHDDNREENMHTLCSNCHRVKSKLFGHLTDLVEIKKIFANNAQIVLQKNKMGV